MDAIRNKTGGLGLSVEIYTVGTKQPRSDSRMYRLPHSLDAASANLLILVLPL